MVDGVWPGKKYWSLLGLLLVFEQASSCVCASSRLLKGSPQ